MEESDEKVKVKSLIDIIGEWGRWQRRFFIYVFFLDFTAAFINMGYTFFSYKMEFWCHDVPHDFPNKTEAMKCFKFTNLTEKCTKWRYDDTIMKDSVVSAFDLVCDRSYLSSLSQALYMVGYGVSGVVFTYLSDRYGRRPVIWIGFAIEILSCISCTFSFSAAQYIVSRFFQGIGIGKGHAMGSMIMELTGPKHRSTILVVFSCGWVFGYVILPGVAFWLKQFRYMQLIPSVMLIFLMIWFWKFYESPRWQIANNRFNEAEQTIRKALKVNGKSDDGLSEKMNQLKEHILMLQEAEGKNRNYNMLTLLKTPNLRKYTLIMCYSIPVQAFIYYGLSYNVGNFGGNFYINFMLSGLVEIPSQLVSLVGFKYMKRKTFTYIFLIAIAVSSLGMIPDNPTSRVIFALIGKFAISTSWWGIAMIKSEIFPTVLRSTASGAISIAGRIGAIAAPFINYLSEKTSDAVVFVLFSILTIVNLILIYFLPETKGNELPDTLLESENYGKEFVKPNDDKSKHLQMNAIES